MEGWETGVVGRDLISREIDWLIDIEYKINLH